MQGDHTGEAATDADFPGGYLERAYRLVALFLDRNYGLLRWARWPRELADALTRFRREAQVLASLNHPNIVRIFDAGEEHDLCYIAMEFLKGKDLVPYTKQPNLLPIEKVLSIVERVADALGFASRPLRLETDELAPGFGVEPVLALRIGRRVAVRDEQPDQGGAGHGRLDDALDLAPVGGADAANRLGRERNGLLPDLEIPDASSHGQMLGAGRAGSVVVWLRGGTWRRFAYGPRPLPPTPDRYF